MFEPNGLYCVSTNVTAGTFRTPVLFCEVEMFGEWNVIFN
jgi:hypothetical protein